MFQNQRLNDMRNNILRIDKMILLLVYALVTISTVFVYSATRESGMVVKNILWIGIGTVLVFLIAAVDYRNVSFCFCSFGSLGKKLLERSVGLHWDRFSCSRQSL